MAKDKLGNLLKFSEYDHLQPKQKPTKYTEVGGYAVLEGLSVKELVKKAASVSGMKKKDLKNLSPKKLKGIIGKNKAKFGKPEEEKKPEVQEDETNENFLFEKKKKLAARKRFISMINGDKCGSCGTKK